VNRTDRLYALVEELRAAAPAHRSATRLAERFGAARTARLASRVHLLESGDRAASPTGLARALIDGRVLRMTYRDAHGAASERLVEPLGYIGKGEDWYLVAWCRLREGVRVFCGDRVLHVEETGERSPARTIAVEELDIPHGVLRPVLGRPGSRSTGS
jgi:predicted DNA-binding transcriptional regulator YafY